MCTVDLLAGRPTVLPSVLDRACLAFPDNLHFVCAVHAPCVSRGRPTCVHVCMYACMCVCMCVCMHVCMYVCFKCMYVCICVYVCTCVCVYWYVCMYSTLTFPSSSLDSPTELRDGRRRTGVRPRNREPVVTYHARRTPQQRSPTVGVGVGRGPEHPVVWVDDEREPNRLRIVETWRCHRHSVSG